MPKVSVILTSYNHSKFICEAIDSALNQTFTDFELIIWDDASTDNSWKLITQYADPRIKTFRNEINVGPVVGVNKAISEIALGEYIAIHHSDDVWLPDKLATQVSMLSSNPSLGAVFTWTEIIDDHGEVQPINWFNQNEMSRWQWLHQLFIGENHLSHPSVLVRINCYKIVGLYKRELAQTPDVDMWVRLLLKYDIHVIPKGLTRHRRFADGKNTSGSGLDKSIRTENEWNIIRLNLFRTASCEDVFQIFPNLGTHYHSSDCVVEYLLAIACLKECSSHAAWTLGLKTLFDIINTPSSAARIKELYNFDYHDLIILTGQIDPFSFFAFNEYEKTICAFRSQVDESNVQINHLNQTVLESNVQINHLNQTVLESNSQIASLRNSTSWRITKPLRFIRRLF